MAQQTRKDPRAKVLSMTVRYKSATLDEFIEHHSHDVSRGGMFIKTPQAFPPGTLLKFEVRIAEDRKVMQGVGRVVWKRELTAADADRPAGMGVKFIKLDDESRRLIDQLLSSRRDEVSAFDAEAGQGIETEATVGLGTEPLSVPPSKPDDDGPSFFPKLEPAELPPPEDRTVMKQAAELLQEALREVGSDGPGDAKAKSVVPAGAEEKEDTKPGRNSAKPTEPAGKLPEPRMPPSRGESPATAKGRSPAVPSGSPPRKIGAADKATDPPPGGSPFNMANAAKEITERAREAAAPKSPVTSGIPPRAAIPNKVTPAAAKPLPESNGKPVAAQPAPTSAASSGAGRGLFWFLAVAACAAGTWWLWRPRPEAPSEAPPAAELQAAPTAAAATPLAPIAASAPTETAEPAAASASAVEPAAPSAAASVPAVAEPIAAAAAVAAAAAAVEPPRAAPKAVAPVRAARRKAASASEGDQPNPPNGEAAEPPASPEAPAAAPKEAEPAAEPKPAAPPPAEPPAPAKAAPAESPPAETPPAAAKKRSAPAADTDNPY